MNSVLRNLCRAGFWIALFLLLLTRIGLADDPPPKLEANLIYLGSYPYHVVVDGGKDLLGYDRWRVDKAKFRPQVKCPSSVLAEPVFDVFSEMVHQGVKMPPGSRALFSPGAGLFYIESTREDVELVESFVYAMYSHFLLSIDLSITLVSPGKTEILQEVKGLPWESGQHLELISKGAGRCDLTLDPTAGFDEDMINIGLEADLAMDGKTLKKSLKKKISYSHPEDMELGALGAATVKVRLQPHRHLDYFGSPFLETDAKKAAAIAEIRKALGASGAPPTRVTIEEAASPLVSDLLFVSSPLHLTPEAHISDEEKLPKPTGLKATIAPELPFTPLALGERAYDVSATFREMGLTFPKGSRALYGPTAKLLYIESTPEDLRMARAIFYSESPPAEAHVDVKVVRKSADREETLLEVESAMLLEGRDVKFSTTGHITFHLMIQSLSQELADGGSALHLGVSTQVEDGGRMATTRSTWLTHHSKPLETTLGQFGDATVTLSIQSHVRQGRWGDDPESEKENKAAVIKEIQESLARHK